MLSLLVLFSSIVIIGVISQSMPGFLMFPFLPSLCRHSFTFLEWLPKSFQSKLAKESNVLSISCTSYVEMLDKNQVRNFSNIPSTQLCLVFNSTLFLSLSQFLLLPQLPTKNTAHFKGVKSDPTKLISLLLPRFSLNPWYNSVHLWLVSFLLL